MHDSIYHHNITNSLGEEISLEDYRGKVLLVVNTASRCGFTPQYEGLEKLYQKYKDQGFEVLAFPCNQFGSQEPGSDEEIQDFCSTHYSVNFPVFKKIEVNGKDAHPLYKYLKSSRPGIFSTEAIKWNFTKFLIDREGNPQKRFSPKVSPQDIEEDIDQIF